MKNEGIGLKTFKDILQVLVAHPNGLTKTELRKQTGISYSHITKLLRVDFIPRELAKFQANPKDKRLVLVTPTTKAIELNHIFNKYNL